MEIASLNQLAEQAWLFAAAPVLAIAAGMLLVWLRVPQFSRLGAAYRALSTEDTKAKGSMHPGAAALLSAVAAYGAAAAVGAATAVSLGGAGAIAWAWLFAFLLAPLRVAETLLARSAPPGQAGAATGSLAHRLLADSGFARGLGFALLGLVPLAAVLFIGGVHGRAVVDAAGELLPGSALPLGLGVAAVAALFAFLPPKKAGGALGWIAVVSVIALFGAALMAFFSNPGRGFGGFARAIVDAFQGAPRTGAFAGALAGEVAFAAVAHLLPPLAAVGGVEGALQSEGRAESARSQASASLLGPFLYAVLTTVLGLSFIATGAFSRPVDTERPLREVTAYRVSFETPSQRLEMDRRLGAPTEAPRYVRILEGEARAQNIEFATERGMITRPRFYEGDSSADIALAYERGVPVALQRPSASSVPRGAPPMLELRPEAELDGVRVRGSMLPRGGRLLAEGITRGAGPIPARIALAALLLLAALGAAGFGLATARTLGARMPARQARFAAALPAIGLALAAVGVGPALVPLGVLSAAGLAIVSALALLMKAKEAAQRLRG